MSEWISVEDEWPENDIHVLAIIKGEIRIANLVTEIPSQEEPYTEFDYWDCPFNYGQDWKHGDVTHWMPLPNPPKKDNE